MSNYFKGLKKLLPCITREKVYKDECSTVSCYFFSWYSEWWKILEGNGQQLEKHLPLPCTVGEDEVIIHKWLVDDISKSMPLQCLSTFRGLVSLIQRFHFRGLQFGNDKKVSTISMKQFHYITLSIQQQPIPFKNIIIGIHHKITSNKWSSIY